MKKCPQCNSQYFDNMLDYCLEDGTKLIVISSLIARQTLENSATPTAFPTLAETASMPPNKTFPQPIGPEVETVQRSNLQNQFQKKSEQLKTSLTDKWYLFLKFTPIVLALAHNYWQWLYLAKQSSLPLSEFLISYQFLIWFLLLISGSVFGIISLKYGKSKSFAITVLVVLAINALLSIVPK